MTARFRAGALALVLGAALACAGCNVLPSSGTDYGTAQATISYQDESGAQQEDLTFDSIFCDAPGGTGSFITVKGDSNQTLNATVNAGETVALTVDLGHDDLVFRSTEPFIATSNSASFTNLVGDVIMSRGGDVYYVDEAATATGSIACP